MSDAAVGSLLAPGSWASFVMISTRLAGVMLVAPFWSMIALPRSVRGAIVVVLAAILVPTSPRAAFPERALEIPVPLATELLIGVAIGIGAAVILHSLTLASEVIALQTGLSLGQLLAPNQENGGPALTQLYSLVAMATFVGVGGHLALVEGLGRSLQALPPGSLVAVDVGAGGLLRVVGAVFANAVQIAGPVLVALTVTNLAMAILSRAVPQLNAMAMAFGVTIGVGLVMLGVSLPLVVRAVARWTAAWPASLDAIVGALAATGR
jgi:flagellar biosynthetic protein FliR